MDQSINQSINQWTNQSTEPCRWNQLPRSRHIQFGFHFDTVLLSRNASLGVFFFLYWKEPGKKIVKRPCKLICVNEWVSGATKISRIWPSCKTLPYISGDKLSHAQELSRGLTTGHYHIVSKLHFWRYRNDAYSVGIFHLQHFHQFFNVIHPRLSTLK